MGCRNAKKTYRNAQKIETAENRLMRSVDNFSVRLNPVVGGRSCSVQPCHRISKFRGQDDAPTCEYHFKKWRKTNALPERICVVCTRPFKPRGQKLTCTTECARQWQLSWRRRVKSTPEGRLKISRDQRRQRDSDEYRAKRYAYETSEEVREKK